MIHHKCVVDLTIGCRRTQVDLTQNNIDIPHTSSVPWSLMTPNDRVVRAPPNSNKTRLSISLENYI